MNVVIIYEDCRLAAKVSEVLSRAVFSIKEAEPWSIRPLRLDLLALPRTVAASLKKAVDAELIVLALQNLAEPPIELLDWLESWAAQRQVQDAALAIINDGGRESLVEAVSPRWARFASRHNLSFIFSETPLELHRDLTTPGDPPQSGRGSVQAPVSNGHFSRGLPG